MDLDDAIRQAFEEAAPPLSSIGELVSAFGGPGRGGGVGRLAGELGVAPRTVQRWLAWERGELDRERRPPPTARARGLTAQQRTTADRIRGLWRRGDVRADEAERRLRGRRMVVEFDFTWEPYPEANRPQWRDGGRWGPLTLPPHRAAPIVAAGLQGLRGDPDGYVEAGARLADELTDPLGLPGEAEVADDGVHALSIAFE